MAEWDLRNDKTADTDARRWTDDWRDVRVVESESGQLLSELAGTGAEAGTDGVAGCDPEAGPKRSALWIPANRPVAKAGRLAGQSQASITADAGRQSVEHPTPSFRGDHRQWSFVAGLSESGSANGPERHQSAVGRRYYLHSIATGVHLFGGDSGCFLATGRGMEHQPSARQQRCPTGVGCGAEATSTGGRADSSFRSRRSVRVWRVRQATGGRRHHDQHESAGQSLGQCLGREFHEDTESRRSGWTALPELR